MRIPILAFKRSVTDVQGTRAATHPTHSPCGELDYLEEGMLATALKWRTAFYQRPVRKLDERRNTEAILTAKPRRPVPP